MSRRLLPPLVGVALVVAAWSAGVALFDPPSYRLPSPGAVARALVDQRSALGGHVQASLTVAVLGLAAAGAVGVVVAVALWRWRLVHRAAYPLLVASQSVPPVVFAPLLSTWFGYGTLPRVMVVTLVGFFPVAVAVTDALVAAPAGLGALVTSMGAGRWRRLALVEAPSALPAFFSGLTLAASYAMFGAIVAEWMGGANEGLGVFINRSRQSFRADQLMAAVVLIAIVSVVLVAVVRLVARAAVPWTRAELRATTSRPPSPATTAGPTPTMPWSPS